MPSNTGLGWTFDAQAEQYEKMRPGYAAALYDDVFAYRPIDNTGSVVEIGIGSGQATLPFLNTGCRLTAVEYGAHLADRCRRKFSDFPNFSVVTAKFEDFPCDENSCDLIYSATAFHWIPEEIGYAKVYALLKSGGAFARFANHPYMEKGRPALHEAIEKLYDVYMPNSGGSGEYSGEAARACAELAGRYGFVDSCYRLYTRTRSFTAEEYTALLGTYSNHIALEEDARTRFFSEIRDTIDRFGGQITVYDTMDLELARKP